ncbi:serine hydrolase [Paucibacter sp. R3-3]|uniref:beta-lactamase n=1 Tax=Roseateles agri TaxID=3098619 RepID=A0ABU5DGJ2_9BURK|nr:serine hydrolase [Paucibacter sp. R3-3]MDY0744843.1 serine hydrolase [Paucibacter sp. R3-3]
MHRNARLAEALLAAVREQRFELTPDGLLGGAPVGQHPSIDLAVAAFPADGAAPLFANVLFSREHPQGLVAAIGVRAGAVENVRYLADRQDADGNSLAWRPGTNWQQVDWQPLAGSGPDRFVAPYPASLLKLMVLVAVARLVDQGRSAWEAPLAFEGRTRSVGDWAMDMIAISCNDATSALVTLLHASGAVAADEVHRLFESRGLTTLRFANTRPDGGWRNADGAGVGNIQMTAWDTVRLLWLLDPDAPPAPWLQAGMPPLLGASRAHVLACLRGQKLHHVLSSRSLLDAPGWVEGIPGELEFAHKTGSTENYASDAGIVRGVTPGTRRHYLIAVTSNLGSRYAPPAEGCVTTWRMPALGAAVDALMAAMLE